MKNGPEVQPWGATYWYVDDELHRDADPAVVSDRGDKWWYVHNKLHRIDGPAIEMFDGYKAWCINGNRVPCDTQEEFERLMRLKAFW